METVTLTSKFQVAIPQRVRKALGLKPGQKVQVIPYKGRIELIPVEPIRRGRGFLRGIDTEIKREQK